MCVYYASSSTATSDTAVQASVQQHGFFLSSQTISRESVAAAIQIWLLSEREIKSFVMLSVLRPEAKTSSDVRRDRRAARRSCSASGGRFFFFFFLHTAEVYPNKGCKSLRVIMKDADTGQGAALKLPVSCWLLLLFMQ